MESAIRLGSIYICHHWVFLPFLLHSCSIRNHTAVEAPGVSRIYQQFGICGKGRVIWDMRAPPPPLPSSPLACPPSFYLPALATPTGGNGPLNGINDAVPSLRLRRGPKPAYGKVSRALDIHFYSAHATIGPFLENKRKWIEPANCLVVVRRKAGNISSKNGGRWAGGCGMNQVMLRRLQRKR